MIEVTKSQLTALMRGEAVAVGPSKRVITIDDGPFAVKHYGPGPHPGTGTPQDVHGGGSTALSVGQIDSVKDLFHVPRTERWDPVRDALESIDQVIGIDIWQELPMKESKAKSRAGAYIIRGNRPKEFSLVVEDIYGVGFEITVVHEIGHHVDHWLLAEVTPKIPNWGSDKIKSLYQSWLDNPEQTLNVIGQEVTLQEGAMVDKHATEAMFQWYDAVANSQAFQDLRNYDVGYKTIDVPVGYFEGDRNEPLWGPLEEKDHGIVRSQIYFSSQDVSQLLVSREIFARSFAQYVAQKTGNEDMLRSISESRTLTDLGLPARQWEESDFQPIADSFDELFRRKLWLKE